eukprot:scaffold88_cov387-Prasinococcus_capsulatus_cf.AAC.14
MAPGGRLPSAGPVDAPWHNLDIDVGSLVLLPLTRQIERFRRMNSSKRYKPASSRAWQTADPTAQP